MRTRITAVSGVQALLNERGYRNQVGHTITKRYKGTESECGEALNTLIANGGVIDASISEDAGGYFVLAASYSSESATGTGGTEDANAVVTVWSREQQRTEKTLWTVPVWITLTNSLADEYARVGLRTAIEDYIEGQATLATLSAVLVANGLTLNNEVVSRLIEHFRKGIEAYPFQTWVIRRSQTGPASFLVNNDLTIGRVWTRSSLVAQPSMPEVFKQFIQAGYYLQSGAQLAQVDTYRWQTTQDWEFGTEFSDWLYGAAI